MNDEPAAQNETPPRFPGAFASCRAKASGFNVNHILCICRPPMPCTHRKVCGENFFCNHPDREAIVELTAGLAASP